MDEILEQKYAELLDLEKKLADPQIYGSREYVAALRRYGVLSKLAVPLRELEKAERDWTEAKKILADPEDDAEMKEYAEQEMPLLEEKMDRLIDSLGELLAVDDENSGRNVVIEIRAGVGGDEAAIFAGDLFEMYRRYIEDSGWKMEVTGLDAAEHGGCKEVTFIVRHSDAWDRLKYEAGAHRVQRVPSTESQGRIHTSAATVVVLPEAEEIEMDIPEKELEISVMRSSGPGGQHVNKTDSCVRIVHLPTGLSVKCQIEKSQRQNRILAMRILRSKLHEHRQRARDARDRKIKSAQAGSGDRSERIRTYNYPQNRVTDHRLEGKGKNFPLDEIMQGKLGPVIEALRKRAKLNSSLKRIS